MKNRQATIAVYGLFGEQLQRRIDRAPLDGFVEGVIEQGGTEARIAWERTGVLGTKLVAPLLPPRLPRPRSVFLRSPLRFRTGLTLQVEFDQAVSLPGYVDDLVRALEGRGPLPELVPEQEGAGNAAPPPSPAPAASPAEPSVPEVEVLQPAEKRAARERDARVQAYGPYGEGDPFGLPFPPGEGMLGESLRIIEADLPWLNPGDRVISERRGRCRITHVEEDHEQVLMRNAQGELLIISAEELLDEFRFDESLHGS